MQDLGPRPKASEELEISCIALFDLSGLNSSGLLKYLGSIEV